MSFSSYNSTSVLVMFFRFPVAPLPFHLEVACYFHVLTTIFRHADADPRDYATIFGFSSVPEFMTHLVLQRTDDARLILSCPATILPPALRPSVTEDLLARYESMSLDPGLADQDFPPLDFGQHIPAEIHETIVQSLIREQRAFILHL